VKVTIQRGAADLGRMHLHIRVDVPHLLVAVTQRVAVA
jgi:hypothetical protein